MATLITIGFSKEFSNKVSAKESIDSLEEHFQIWVFDLYYAKTLHEISQQDKIIAEKLREDMEAWAVQFSSKVFMPMEKILESGLEYIDKNQILVTETIQYQDMVFEITVEYPEGQWPVIYTKESEDFTLEKKALTVKALAQYYFIKNKLFRRELSIHILAIRKYYEDGLPYTHPQSMLEAPLFALNKAMEYFQSINQTQEN